MKIIKKQVETYIVRTKWLDTMRISIEPFKDGKYWGGVVTITCADSKGSYIWGSCGSEIKKFLTRINFGYWSEKLFYTLTNSRYLPEETRKTFLKDVTEYRRAGDLNKEQAKKLYEYIKDTMPMEDDSDHWVAHWVMDDLRDFAEEIGKEGMYDDWDYIPIQKTWDSHLLHMWFKGWVPFIQELCKELKIEYREPRGPECEDFYKRTPEDTHKHSSESEGAEQHCAADAPKEGTGTSDKVVSGGNGSDKKAGA